jgi:hypothetical protein
MRWVVREGHKKSLAFVDVRIFKSAASETRALDTPQNGGQNRQQHHIAVK